MKPVMKSGLFGPREFEFVLDRAGGFDPWRVKLIRIELNRIDDWVLVCTYWIPTLLTTALSVVPWLGKIRWRYSLRTLLIATTLVAVVLGLIVWAVKG
jgi:hypothetical protein